MKVLIACEESQVVCKAFRELGHEAFSCDILPCSGGHPEWHIQCDVLEIIGNGDKTIVVQSGDIIYIQSWDLMIAHPPCTYLSNAGARWLYPKGVLNKERYAKGIEAKEFLLALLNANIPHIAVENPLPSKIFRLPNPSQVIQPFDFGHPESKKTFLWTKNLPILTPTTERLTPNRTQQGGRTHTFTTRLRKAIERSKTFPGIAAAMAQQWGAAIV
jgi:hypothetical protein